MNSSSHSCKGEHVQGCYAVIKPLAVTLALALALLAGIVSYANYQAMGVPVLAGNSQAVAKEGSPGSYIRVAQYDGTASVCSLGVPWTSAKGDVGWLTAAHCFSKLGQTVFGSLGPIGTGEVSGTLVDASFVKAKDSKLVRPELVINGVTTPIVDVAPARVGDSLCVIGTTSGLTCGWEVISEKDTVEVENDRNVIGAVALGRGSECASKGDSGGLVFTLDDDKVTAVGTVVAVRNTPELTSLIPATCTVVLATAEQSSAVLGGSAFLD